MFPTFISILDIQSWWEVPSIAHFCSLFRTAFNLLDFDIEDLEEALLTDGTEESSWLQELIVRLLSGCLPNNEISTFNYQMFLRRLFRQKCQEHDRYNPFNTDCDFTLLPLRTKVDILHALCDFRLDAEDVLDQLKNLEADSLRVEPLGYDSNDSAYWYFYGTRLYREDFQKKNNKKKSIWQVICFTEDDWFQLTKKFKNSTSKSESALYHTLSKNFLPELPRLFKEKERQARRRLLENQPRRTSDRIRKLDIDTTERQETEESRLVEQKKEVEDGESTKKRKEQENRRNESYEKRSQLRQGSEEGSQSESEPEKRHEMAAKKKGRGRQRKASTDTSENGKEITPSKRKKTRSSEQEEPPKPTKPATVGRQTNNSLSAADGQIVIQPAAAPTASKKKLKTSQVFQQTDEDLQVGMHKVLDYVKNHDDAWPFVDPVEEEYAPNYYSIIRRPMDLTRMEDRLDQGTYKTFDKFQSDFQLIVNNCRLYNGVENEYTEMVDNLLKVFEKATERYLDQISSSDEEIAVENLNFQTETSDMQILTLTYIQLTGSKPPPSSPLKILNPESIHRQRVESPMSQEDEEVSFISVSAGKSEVLKRRFARACDSVLPDLDDSEYNKEGEDLEHGSPCTAGGLHMPNSKSINNFKKRISRFRYHSQCNPEPERIEMSTGSSPGNGVPFSGNSTVRRANSCPDMKKSPLAPLKDNKTKPFYETDEETVSEDQVSNTSNGVDLARARKQKSVPVSSSATQTEVFWPMPYEHLFLNIFPSLKDETTEIKPSPVPSPAPALNQAVEQYKPSLYDILDKYIEKCVSTADNNNSLREQLQLVHQQLLFERHRRETHAYRNRRLLSDAKSTRLLEEYNSALRDQVQLEQKEIDDLRKQLEEYRREATDDQRQLSSTIQFLQDKCKNLTDDNNVLKEINKKLESDMVSYKSKCNSLDKERQQAEAALLDALVEGKVAREQALAGEKVKQELQRVNRELLLMGELHVNYRQRLERLPSMRQCDEEMKNISEAYREEVKSLQHIIEAKTATMDAYKSRIVELEHMVSAKDEIIGSQKRTLASVNEGREALLEAVESKYQTQLAINRTLEEKILELRQKLEVEANRRKMHSPDTSSCHEVQVTTTTTAGLSPHSSPLSASLASSEGSAAFQDREVRNLQVYVDQEGSSKGYSEEGQLVHSSKND